MSEAKAKHYAGLAKRIEYLRVAVSIIHYAGLQSLAQIISILSGIVIIRHMLPQQYGYFVLAATAASAIAVVGDSGITSGMSAIGGRIWNDAKSIGRLLATAMFLQWRLFLLGILFALPIMPGVFVAREIMLGTMCGLGAIAVVTAYLQLRLSIFSAVPRLLLEPGTLAVINLTGSIVRLALIALLAVTSLLSVYSALIFGLAAVFLQLQLLQRWVGGKVPLNADMDSDFKTRMRALSTRQLPGTLFYLFQGHLVIFLAGLFGTTESVANIGALGRLGILVAICVSILNDVIQPRFTRLQEPGQIWRSYIVMMILLVAAGSLLVLAAVVLPSPMLWILGEQYLHLERELPIAVGSAALSTLATAAHGFNMSRGWILHGKIAIPVGLATQAVLLYVCDLNSIAGLLLMNCFAFSASVLFSACYTYYNIRLHSKATDELNAGRSGDRNCPPSRRAVTESAQND
jgi:O-antigen/teichoic acid export membrane protein